MSEKQTARRAVYPGTFDPVTLGHMDLIARASGLFDTLVVAVLRNTSKTPLFDLQQRRQMIEEAVREAKLTNVEVTAFEGLLTDFARREQAQVVVRGFRAISDTEYELQMALMNRRLDPGIETVFFAAGEDVSFISSSLVREIARLGGDVSGLVPGPVNEHLARRLSALEEQGK